MWYLGWRAKLNSYRFKIGYIKAFTDNYIWFLDNSKEIIIIDPGESEKILEYIIVNKRQLKAIVLTHDHHDHIGGVEEILAHFPVPTYGITDIASIIVADNQDIFLHDELKINTIATPGHTYSSLCYLIQFAGSKHLFCGDTLFAAGCGRVFTGDFVAMFNSLTKLSQLDSTCYIYPGHEYTLKNLQFAKFLQPENPKIEQRVLLEQKKLNTYGNTLPVTLAVELETNPFLRCYHKDIVNAVSEKVDKLVIPGLECFKHLRQLRDNF